MADDTGTNIHDILIPKQLNKCRFIGVRAQSKTPIESGWQHDRNYPYDDPRCKTMVNYGVMVAGGVCVFDVDDISAIIDDPFFTKYLLNTFTVRTGRAEGMAGHFYFMCPDLPSKKFNILTDGKDIGDIRGSGSPFFTVGPGSTHPSGKRYEVINDVPIIDIPLAIVQDFISRHTPKKTTPDKVSSRKSGSISDDLMLNVTDFMQPSNPVTRGDEVQGAHPIHGSETGENFTVNIRKNTWHCFRHNCGGGPLEAMAVAAGIIDCADVAPGCLEGHWSEVFRELESRGYKVNVTPKTQPVKDEHIEQDPVYSDEVIKEYQRVMAEEDPIEYLLEVFHTEHIGDDPVALCCYFSAASRVVRGCKGLHVLTIGPTGKGKSATYNTVLEQMPDRYKIDGAMSDKALFYHSIPEGAIFILDDKAMSLSLQETFRSATSDIQKQSIFRTLGPKRDLLELTLPRRCVWWMAGAEDETDDQFHNRCLQPYIDASKQADDDVLAHLLKMAGNPVKTERDPRFEVCKAIWDDISKEILPVWVWFAEAIVFTDSSNRRNPAIMLDMIMAVARIRYVQRDRDEYGNIIATPDDFKTAADLYQILTGEGGSQITQLTQDEFKVLEYIKSIGGISVTVNDVTEGTGMPQGKVYRLLHGRKDRDQSGIMDKCPALTYKHETVSVTDADHVSRGHRENKYNLNINRYDAWTSAGGVYLDQEKMSDIINDFPHFSQSFPSLFPKMGKLNDGSNDPKLPSTSTYNNNNNNNISNIPKESKEIEEEEEEEEEEDYVCANPFWEKTDHDHQKPMSTPPIDETKPDLCSSHVGKVGGNGKREGMLALLGLVKVPEVSKYHRIVGVKTGRCICKGCNASKMWEDEDGMNYLCDAHYKMFKER